MAKDVKEKKGDKNPYEEFFLAFDEGWVFEDVNNEKQDT